MLSDSLLPWQMSSWKSFNAEDSWIPLILPLCVWLGGFAYCHGLDSIMSMSIYSPTARPVAKRPTFHQWRLLHDIHNFGGMALAVLSLYFHDDAVFSERISILWTLGYFGVDLVDCISRRDVLFTLHAFFCVVLGIGCYTSPVFRELRINSKALLCELSTPFLHLAKQTRQPHHFALFALVFALCRVVWLPVFLYELRHHDLKWFDFRIIFVFAFYGLNLFWFYKIVRILVRYSKGETTRKKQD